MGRVPRHGYIDLNGAYRTEIALWSDTVKKVPGNAGACNNLGTALSAQGNGPAAAEFAAAVAADPQYAPRNTTWESRCSILGTSGQGAAHLEKALAAPRHQGELHLHLGEARRQLGRFAEAVPTLREAVEARPGQPGCRLHARQRPGPAGPLRGRGRLSPGVPCSRAHPPAKQSHRSTYAGRLDEAITEDRAASASSPSTTAPSAKTGPSPASDRRRRSRCPRPSAPDARSSRRRRSWKELVEQPSEASLPPPGPAEGIPVNRDASPAGLGGRFGSADWLRNCSFQLGRGHGWRFARLTVGAAAPYSITLNTLQNRPSVPPFMPSQRHRKV